MDMDSGASYRARKYILFSELQHGITYPEWFINALNATLPPFGFVGQTEATVRKMEEALLHLKETGFETIEM